jgi:hypothetical protein
MKGMPAAKQKKAEFSDTFFSPGTMQVGRDSPTLAGLGFRV